MLGIRSRRSASCPGIGMEMSRLPSVQRLQTCSRTGNCNSIIDSIQSLLCFLSTASFRFILSHQQQDTVLLCCECDTTFHRSCLTSPPATMPDGCYWACDDCRANESVEKTPVKDSSSEEGKVENKISSSSSSSFQPLAPISLGPWVFGTRQLELKGPPFEWNCVNPDPSIPDASHWTSEDVQSYFSRLGFEEQAALLRHNVIHQIIRESRHCYRFSFPTTHTFFINSIYRKSTGRPCCL
jgi:hypothetical protein